MEHVTATLENDFCIVNSPGNIHIKNWKWILFVAGTEGDEGR